MENNVEKLQNFSNLYVETGALNVQTVDTLAIWTEIRRLEWKIERFLIQQEATASLSSFFYNSFYLAEKCTNFMVNFTDKNGNYGFFFLIKEVAKMGNII